MTIDLPTYLSRAGFVGIDPESCQRLGGLTNLNFLVAAAHEGADSNGRYVLRIPGEGTSEYINRSHEEVAARSAAAAGVNAELVFFDSTDGLMVTRFAEGARTMTPENFRDLGAVSRAGSTLRRLHNRATSFASDFALFTAMDDYKRLLATKGASLPSGYEEVETHAELLRAVLAANPVPLVASHCDPLCENFLDTGESMLLIDYEYSGNNDPMWDLGDLSVEGNFTQKQDTVLLRSYFGAGPGAEIPQDQIGRMIVYKALCDLMWSLWGILQHANKNPVDDFWAYGVGRFERCRTLMNSPDFASHVASINV